MSKVRCEISISLDGYVAGPDQSEENPLGVGGMALHEWVFGLPAFHGSGEEVSADGASSSNAVVEESTQNIGAVVMGRNMFGPIRGDWGDESWRGWWGDTPPYSNPVYVLTHHERESLEMEGGTTFHFVTDGVESALAQAKESAGDEDVSIGGGGSTIRQCLATGQVDELQVHIAPILLGDGVRLFEKLRGTGVKFEAIRTVHAPDVTHIKYAVS